MTCIIGFGRKFYLDYKIVCFKIQLCVLIAAYLLFEPQRSQKSFKILIKNKNTFDLEVW